MDRNFMASNEIIAFRYSIREINGTALCTQKVFDRLFLTNGRAYVILQNFSFIKEKWTLFKVF